MHRQNNQLFSTKTFSPFTKFFFFKLNCICIIFVKALPNNRKLNESFLDFFSSLWAFLIHSLLPRYLYLYYKLSSTNLISRLICYLQSRLTEGFFLIFNRFLLVQKMFIYSNFILIDNEVKVRQVKLHEDLSRSYGRTTYCILTILIEYFVEWFCRYLFCHFTSGTKSLPPRKENNNILHLLYSISDFTQI